LLHDATIVGYEDAYTGVCDMFVGEGDVGGGEMAGAAGVG
jgi:hypothetical protein